MKHLIIGLLSVAVLAGCSAGTSVFNKKSDPAASAAPVPPPPSGGGAPAAPYSLDAQASGGCVNFTITNFAGGDLQVSPNDFAMIPRGTRQVVPYNPQTVTVDVPSVVPAGQSVTGRAIFQDYASPSGNKLVFKPDNLGTFATIGSGGATR